MTMTTDGDSHAQKLPWSWTGLFELAGATQVIVKERKWVNQHSRPKAQPKVRGQIRYFRISGLRWGSGHRISPGSRAAEGLGGAGEGK